MKNKKKFFILVSLVWTLMLLSVVTYSWIARSWTPKLEYPKVSVATTGALVITFDDNSVYNEVNLNDLTGIDDFALKQVSSSDGINFVSANFNPILENGVPVYDDVVKDKYIETEFWLKTQYESDTQLADRKKEVFISPDSYISYVAEDGETAIVNRAIRISIEVQNVRTYILCADLNDGSTGIYSLIAAPTTSVGMNIYEAYPDKTLNRIAYVPVQVYSLNYFNGEKNADGTSKSLFTIDSASAQKVTVRIWLEGCDDNCVNEIAGKSLSICLKFDSREVISSESE